MPYYSELGLYTTPSSTYSSSFLKGPYSGHSSLIASNFLPPSLSKLPYRNHRGFKPHLTTISESNSPLRRVNSPKLHYHSSPKVRVPRPIKINTADIDVSRNRYWKYQNRPNAEGLERTSPERTLASPKRTPSPSSSTAEKEAKPNTHIRRDRATVRLKTIHKDAVSKELGEIRSWRDNFEPEELITEAKVRRKTPGEILKEKFLIRSRSKENIPKALDPKKISRKASVKKSPSFHDICAAITSESIDDDLNPGQPEIVKRRQSRQFSSDDLLKELKRTSSQLSTEEVEILDALLSADQEIASGLVSEETKKHELPNTVKKKKATKKKSNEKVTLDDKTEKKASKDSMAEYLTEIEGQSPLRRRPTLKKLRRSSTDTNIVDLLEAKHQNSQNSVKDVVKDISNVEIESIPIKPKPVITASVGDIEAKVITNLTAVISDVEVQESPKPKREKKFRFNVTVEEIPEKQKKNKITARKIELGDEHKKIVQLPKPQVPIVSSILKKKLQLQVGHILTDIKELPQEESQRPSEIKQVSNSTEKNANDVQEKSKVVKVELNKRPVLNKFGLKLPIEPPKTPEVDTKEASVLNKSEPFAKLKPKTPIRSIGQISLHLKTEKEESSRLEEDKKVQENSKLSSHLTTPSADDVRITKTENKEECKLPKTDRSTLSPPFRVSNETDLKKIELPVSQSNQDIKEDKSSVISPISKSIINKSGEKKDTKADLVISKQSEDKVIKESRSPLSPLIPKSPVNKIAEKEDIKTEPLISKSPEDKDNKESSTSTGLINAKSITNKLEENKETRVISNLPENKESKTSAKDKSTPSSPIVKSFTNKLDTSPQSSISRQLENEEDTSVPSLPITKLVPNDVEEDNDIILESLISKLPESKTQIKSKEPPKSSAKLRKEEKTKKDENDNTVNFWDTNTHELKSDEKDAKTLIADIRKQNDENKAQVIVEESETHKKRLISKRSLIQKANKEDPDLEVFEPPEEPEPKEPEPSPEPAFVPLQSNRLSAWMHPWKKPEQMDECPVEIYAKPKIIRGRHYPRRRGHPAPVVASESEGSSSSEEETTTSEEESSSEEEEEETSGEECESNAVNKIGASTSSNDSGFDSARANGARNKGSVDSRDSPSTHPAAYNPAFALDAGDDAIPVEFSTSSTYAGFQKSGRITPPATTIPRFRKYCVDDFNFLKVLGKGSFGKVLLAELKDTEYYYAVKCLKKDVVLEDDDVECTLIERKVLALGTKHPYLCHLLCTFQTESHLFFVMEYLNGGDLMFHIQAERRFSEVRARFYGAEIVSGLKFLHNKGIVYRDLKLDNILLDFDGHVRIADFGMCKLQIFLDRMAETFCGTPDYMAPEIIKGQHYNQCVDWWSFGVLLYEMLIGQSPFSGCDEDELFWSICNEKPVIPRFLSQEASAILVQFLEKDANKRLGNRFCPAGDIQDQPFFRSIDWQALEARQLESPFKPNLQHPLDTQYFDKTFTVEKAKLTPIETTILQSMDQTQFQGFSYTNPNATDK